MKSKTDLKGDPIARGELGGVGDRPSRPLVRLALMLAVVIAAAWVIRARLTRPALTESATESPATPALATPDPDRTMAGQSRPEPLAIASGEVPTTTIAAVSIAPKTPASARSAAMVVRLCQAVPAGGTLTPELAAAWKELMQQTVALGPEAVPAVRDFLARNEDFLWGAEARTLLGYDTARAAMFDVLLQIGGADAEAVLGTTLGSTLDPREIALLARNLDTLSPGQHVEASVDAARQALAAAGRGELTDRDVAPAFEVLKRFGGATVTTDLDQAATRWNYYATIALAQLPEGAGVPSLIRLAEATDGPSLPASDAAIRMLGNMAGQNDEARAAFLDLAKKGRISDTMWSGLAPILAGDPMQFTDGVLGTGMPTGPGTDIRSTHLSYGNQSFYTSVPTAEAGAALREGQLKWLDQLAGVATGQDAQNAVQQAKLLIGHWP